MPLSSMPALVFVVFIRYSRQDTCLGISSIVNDMYFASSARQKNRKNLFHKKLET